MATTAAGASGLEKALSPTEQRVLEFIRRFPNGATNDAMRSELPYSPDELVNAINRLLATHFVEIYKNPNGSVVFKETRNVDISRVQELTEEENMVYQLIKQGGNMGAWTRDIRTRSSLQQSQVLKILKTLESRQLIKSVKSVESKNKRLYMLAGIEPSRQITGGAWYSEQEFDSEYINVLSQTCLAFIQSKTKAAMGQRPGGFNVHAGVSVAEVAEHIQKLKVSRIVLTHEDISMILHTLLLDGKIELVDEAQETYRATPGGADSSLVAARSGMTQVPCVVCPVFRFCTKDGPINPSNCEYYTAWLNDL